MSKWIDVFGIIRSHCIHCGNPAIEGNTCFECWKLNGRKCRWTNIDIGKFNNLLEMIVVP